VAVFEGDTLELEVGLDTSGAERGPAWIAGAVGGRPISLGTGLVPRPGWRQRQLIDGLRRGLVAATGWVIGTSDPLGFFRGTRSSPDAEAAVVLPRFTSLVAMRAPREVESSLATPRTGSGMELFGVREYRPGDSLRRIHWRSSARRGELVVREYEPPGLHTLTLILDPAPPSADVADQVARIAASEAWDCIREGGFVSIGDVQSTRDLWAVLEWLARYPIGPSGAFSPSVAFGPSVGFADTSPQVGRTTSRHHGEDLVVVTADPQMLETPAVRRWLVGDAPAPEDISFQRVGLQWPL
jgi:hypothetical protein